MRTKKNKKSALQKSLFKRYIIGFIIFQVIFQIIVQLGVFLLTDVSAKYFFSANDVYEKVKNSGSSNVFQAKNLPADAYMEVLDLNYKVKTSLNSYHAVGYVYSSKDIRAIGCEKIENVKLFFLPKSQELLIIKEQSLSKQSGLFVLVLLLFLFFMLFMYIVFFKIMAKSVSITLEKPLQNLIDGVNAFKNKVYTHRITFTAKNELDDLKNAFNDMAAALENEMSRRKEAEAITQHLMLDIAHDLKTPLTNIKGYSELLRENHSLDSTVKAAYLDIIIANSERTDKLMTDLFDLIYCDVKSADLVKHPINLSEFLRRLLSEYVAILEDKENEYELDIPDEPVWVDIDSRMAERAVSNILNNFLKYSGKNAKLIVSLKNLGKEAILIIEDNGLGIPKENCESVFLPFVTQDDSRNSKSVGTGLGLAIAKKVFESHNGSIELISDTNKGCKFIIKLALSLRT